MLGGEERESRNESTDSREVANRLWLSCSSSMSSALTIISSSNLLIRVSGILSVLLSIGALSSIRSPAKGRHQGAERSSRCSSSCSRYWWCLRCSRCSPSQPCAACTSQNRRSTSRQHKAEVVASFIVRLDVESNIISSIKVARIVCSVLLNLWHVKGGGELSAHSPANRGRSPLR